jgi:hypothetical protein
MGDRYFHISETPINRYEVSASSRSALKTSLHTGKPAGLWYATGDVWAAHTNAAFHTHGVSRALQMALGTIPVQEHDRLNLRRIANGNKQYIYELPLAGVPRTTNVIAEPNPHQILVLNAANLQAFITTYFDDSEEIKRSELLQFINEHLADVDPGEYIQELLARLNKSDDELNDILEQDPDAAEDYIQDMYSSAYEVEDYFTEETDAYIIPDEEGRIHPDRHLFPTRSWVNAQIWVDIWTTQIKPRFGGVEFAADIIDVRDPRCPWLPYLEVASGCIFNPIEFFGRTEPHLLKVIGLRPTNMTPGRNVFGQKNGAVYKAVNRPRRNQSRRRTSSDRRAKKVTQRRRRVSA